MTRDYRWLESALKSDAPPEVISDWLTDEGHDLSQVLHLFAGVPPTWREGITKEVLVCWLRASGDRRWHGVAVMAVPEPSTKRSMRHVGHPTRFVGYGREGPMGCPWCALDASRTIVPTITLTFTTRDEVGRKTCWGRCDQCVTLSWSLDSDWVEMAEMKRRVLFLFGDVEVTDVKACQCTRVRFPYRNCRCDGLGFYRPGGKVRADRLIPEREYQEYV